MAKSLSKTSRFHSDAVCNPMRMESGFKVLSNSKPPETENKVSIIVASKKRRTAGFHIYPEYEAAVNIIALYGRHGNKGRALEYLVDHYLSSLPESQQKQFLNLIEGKQQNGHDFL